MSRLCLDSPMASHLTRFTSLSSNEGSQGSLNLISTTSALTSTALSLSLTPFQTHRAFQHCLDMPSITLPQGVCICCSFCLERSYLGLARGFLALFLGSCLYERSARLPCENQLPFTLPLFSILLILTPVCFFSLCLSPLETLHVYLAMAVVTFSPPPQLECKLHKDRDLGVFFFFSLKHPSA